MNRFHTRGWASRATDDDKPTEVGLKPLKIPNRPERWGYVQKCDLYGPDDKISDDFGE